MHEPKDPPLLMPGHAGECAACRGPRSRDFHICGIDDFPPVEPKNPPDNDILKVGKPAAPPEPKSSPRRLTNTEIQDAQEAGHNPAALVRDDLMARFSPPSVAESPASPDPKCTGDHRTCLLRGRPHHVCSAVGDEGVASLSGRLRAGEAATVPASFAGCVPIPPVVLRPDPEHPGRIAGTPATMLGEAHATLKRGALLLWQAGAHKESVYVDDTAKRVEALKREADAREGLRNVRSEGIWVGPRKVDAGDGRE